MTSEKPDQETLQEALEATLELERVKRSHDHRMQLQAIRNLLIGVYDMEIHQAQLDQEKLKSLRQVIEGIDPTNQDYSESDVVQSEKRDALQYIRFFEEY